VVGAGNVALDVARVLARDPGEMAGTDVPDPVLDLLRTSAVRDVHVLIRRAPQHVRFTPAELRQIGELPGVDVLVHDDGLLAAGVPEPDDRRQRQNLEILRRWAAEPPSGGARRIHLRFLRSPVRIDGAGGRVAAVVAERNAIDDQGRVRGTGEPEVLDAGLVVRAIGYRGEPVPGLPFDEDSGTVPNEAGRVVRDGQPVPGAYVTGWIKRGPTGVIGTQQVRRRPRRWPRCWPTCRRCAPAHPEPEALRATLARTGSEPGGTGERVAAGRAEEVRRGGTRAAERGQGRPTSPRLLEHVAPRAARLTGPGAAAAGRAARSVLLDREDRGQRADQLGEAGRLVAGEGDRAGHRAVGDTVADVDGEVPDRVGRTVGGRHRRTGRRHPAVSSPRSRGGRCRRASTRRSRGEWARHSHDRLRGGGCCGVQGTRARPRWWGDSAPAGLAQPDARRYARPRTKAMPHTMM
jgi:hypothetical protein